ncbi:hypothetical protein SAMCCGM7_pA0301 (plasmid) [Sinorhizobium americanum CCGM7]|nr:hypothetical protein SAMCCGM7_pA0301 [Sinorhizobium americanum CCGM7]
MLANVLEGKMIEPIANLVMNGGRNRNPAWRGEAFDPRRDIDLVAEKIARLDHYVAEVDPDPEPHSVTFRQVKRQVGKAILDFDCRPHRLNGACEFYENAVAGLAEYPSAAFFNHFGNCVSTGVKCGMRALLVDPHEPAIAGHVGRKNRGKSTLHGVHPAQ